MANGKPLDAMFVRNYLQIYFVQDKDYAMVDCNYICKDPNRFGDDKPPSKTTDFNTVDHILGMYVLKNKMLYMFHEKSYYELTIQPDSKDGKLVTIKSTVENNIIKDFMKIATPGQCLSATPPPESPADVKPPAVAKDESGKDESGGSSVLILIIVFIVIVVVVIIGAVAFFAIKPKSGVDEEAAKEKGKLGAAAGAGPVKAQPSPKGGAGKAAKPQPKK